MSEDQQCHLQKPLLSFQLLVQRFSAWACLQMPLLNRRVRRLGRALAQKWPLTAKITIRPTSVRKQTRSAVKLVVRAVEKPQALSDLQVARLA
jgi:hypothetical protein